MKISHLFWALIFLSLSGSALSQGVLIEGRVIDGQSKIPVEFATIYLIGTNSGASTDSEGNFVIHTDKLPDSISINQVGYLPVKLKLNPENLRRLLFELQHNENSLSEVQVVADKDPGARLMRKVFAHKQDNNPDQFDNYSYKVYTRSELDLRNFDPDKLSKNISANMLTLFNRLDTSNISRQQLPIYFTEVLSDNYHGGSPIADKENIIAKKSLGLETDKLLPILDKFSIQVNPYDNWLNIFKKTFVSPLSNKGLFYYKYYLSDSETINGRKRYRIQFVPIQKYAETFTGIMWINDSTFSLSSLDMKMSETANINYVQSILISELYDTLSSETKKYIPHKTVSVVSFESGLDLIGIPISSDKRALHLTYTSTRIFSDFNAHKNDSDLLSTLSKKNSSFNNFQKGNDFWNKNRTERLTLHEQSIYVMIDSFKKNRRFQRTTKIAAFAGTGFWDFGNKWRIGPYSSFISMDQIEGIRIRSGIWSLQGIDDHWNINGYIAYGTKDGRIKGGVGIKYLHSINPWVKTSIYARSDYDVIIDYDDELDRDNIISSILRKPIPSTRSYINEIKLQHEQQLTNSWMNNVSLTYKEYNPVFNFQYLSIDHEPNKIDSAYYHKLPVAEISTNFKFSPKQGFVVLNYDRINLFTTYPVLTFNYTYGFELFNTQFTYHKASIGISQNLKLPPKSILYYHLKIGKTFGTLPYVLLDIPRGNEFYVSSKYSFNTMSPYEFVADRYISLQTRLSLGGLLLDKIPYMQKLQWRERISFNSYWGDLSSDNIALNSNSNIHTLGATPFAETGVGLENIFHCLSLEYIWRLNYLSNKFAIRSGLFVGITFNF